MERETLRILHLKTFIIPIITIRELEMIKKIISGDVYVYKISKLVFRTFGENDSHCNKFEVQNFL